MFSGGFVQIGFILFIAFLLFGPKKLPEIARALGKGLAELRRASNELKNSLEEEITNLDRREEPPEPVSTYGHDHTGPTSGDTAELKDSLEEEITNLDRHEEPPEPVSTYGHDHTEPASGDTETRT